MLFCQNRIPKCLILLIALIAMNCGQPEFDPNGRCIASLVCKGAVSVDVSGPWTTCVCVARYTTHFIFLQPTDCNRIQLEWKELMDNDCKPVNQP